MLPEQVTRGEGHDVVLLDESARERALARARLAEHEHAEDPAVGGRALARVAQGERQGLLGRRAAAERAAGERTLRAAEARADGRGEAGAGDEGGHAQREGGEEQEGEASLCARAHMYE